jgi:tetratricopeptide (TPR) repeat protein
MQPGDFSARIIALERSRDYRGAYQLLREALARYPNHPFFLKNEVYLLMRLKRLGEAREKAEAVFHIFNRDPFFLRTYLGVLDAMNLDEEIERLLAAAADWDIRDEAFRRFARALRQKRTGRQREQMPRFDGEGRAVRNEAVKDGYALADRAGGAPATPAPENEPAPSRRFYRERFEGRPLEEAVAEIETIMALPDYDHDEDLHLCLAELYKKAGRYDRAAAVYEKVLRWGENGFVRKLLGFALYRAGDLRAAQGQMREAFLEDPNDHFLTSTLRKLYRERGDPQGWEDLLAEALARHPEAVRLHGLLKKARKERS